MAITIHLYYTGPMAKQFAQEMLSSGAVEEVRAEEGNLRYEYYLPFDDEETVLLIDSWQDQQALDRHHHAPVMQKIIRLREKYDLHMRIERYVTDENGVPEKDRKYIRT